MARRATAIKGVSMMVTPPEGAVPTAILSDADRAHIHAVARDEAVRSEQDRRANAFPIITEKIVRADVCFWRGHDARVTWDEGPARDGSRQIEIERIHGPRAGEKITVRRDRVALVPGEIGHSAAAGRNRAIGS